MSLDPGDRRPGGEPGQKVLLLMSSRTYRAGAFLEAADALGIPVVVGTEAETPLAGRRGLHLDFSDPGASCAAIEAYAAETPVAAVVAAEDDGTWLAAEAARRLGIPHNPPEAVALTRDKAAMREHMAEAHLPTPKGMRIDMDLDPEDVAGQVEYPSVLKPRFLAGSQGVIRVDSPGEMVFAFNRVRRLVRLPEIRRLGASLADSLWCEAYLPGDEVALEGMLQDGELSVLAIFDKPDLMEGPFFEETIYVTPSRHPNSAQQGMAETAQETVDALGLRTGPVHIEMRVQPDNVVVIDVAARSIGGLCSKSLRFENGETLESIILRQALGEDVRRASREAVASGVMMIPIPQGGTLEAVSGQEAARSIPGVDEVIISVPLGTKLVPLPEGGSYLGFIFARSETPAMVEEALRNAHRELSFVVRPG